MGRAIVYWAALVSFSAFTIWAIKRALKWRQPSDFSRVAVGIFALVLVFTKLPGKTPLFIAAVAINLLLRRKARKANEAFLHDIEAIARQSETPLDREPGRFLNDPDPKIRKTALVSCAAHGDEAELSRVMAALLRETDADVVLETARSLLKAGRLFHVGNAWAEFPVPMRRRIAEFLLMGDWKSHRRAVMAFYQRIARDDDPTIVAVALEAARSNKLDLKFPEETINARTGWIPMVIPAPAGRLRCQGGELAFAAGDLRLDLRFKHERHRTNGEKIDTLRVSARFADSEGREWKVRSFLQPTGFTDALDDHQRRAAVTTFVSWKDAPAGWRTAMREGCLVAGLRELLDGRERFDLTVSSKSYTVMMKYQYPGIDVAQHERSLLVRISDLEQELYDGEEFEGRVAIAPFGWRTDADILLCFAHPEYHCGKLEEVLTFAEPEEYTMPIACPTERTVEPQPGVTFRRSVSET